MRSGHRPSGAVDDELADQSSRHTYDKRTPNIAERFRPSRNLYTEKTILSAALTPILASKPTTGASRLRLPCLRSAASGLGCSDLDPEVRRRTCRDRDTQHQPAYDSRRRAGKSGRRVRLRREHATQDPTQRPVRAGVRSMRHARPLAPRPGSLEGLSAADLLGPDHPLVRAAETVSTATRQSIAIATVFAGSVVAASAGARPAVSIAVSAGIVLAAVVIRGAASRQQQRPRDRSHPSGPRDPASHRDPAPTTTPHRSPHEAGTRPSDRNSDLPGHDPAQAPNPRHHTPVRCQSRRTSDGRAGRSRRAIARALPSRSRSRARRAAANGRTLAAIRTLRASAQRRAAARHASAGHVTSRDRFARDLLTLRGFFSAGQDPKRDTRSTSLQAGARRPRVSSGTVTDKPRSDEKWPANAGRAPGDLPAASKAGLHTLWAERRFVAGCGRSSIACRDARWFVGSASGGSWCDDCLVSSHTLPARSIRLLAAPARLYDWDAGWLLGRRFLRLTHAGRRSGRVYRTMLESVGEQRSTRELFVVAGLGRSARGIATCWPGRRWRSRSLVRFRPIYREVGPAEAVGVLAAYEDRNRLIAPVLRLVLSRLVGWRYDSTPAARLRLLSELPMIAFRPAT